MENNYYYLVADLLRQLRKDFVENEAFKVAGLSSDKYAAADYEKSQHYFHVLSSSYVELVFQLMKLSEGVEFLAKLHDYQSKS